MAKIGKTKGNFDPFASVGGRSALAAISESMASLESEPEVVVEEPPPVPALEKRQVREAVEPAAAESVVVETKRAAPAAKAKVKAGGGENALGTMMRFRTTKPDKAKVEKAVMRLGMELGSRSIDVSKVTRALWEIYLRHEQDVLRNLPRDEVWENPATHDAVAMARLDERLTEVLDEGLMVAGRRFRGNRDR